jgi:hypothetical protein
MKRIIFLLLLTSLFVGKTNAQSTVAAGQSIFIYNFTRLIEWPNKDGEFVIGVLGSNDVAFELGKYTAGKNVGLQKIVVKKFKEVTEITSCNILFIASAKTSKMPEILSKTGSSHTLLVTEKRGGLDAGAAINFILNEDKLKFEIKTSNATKYGLRVNSKLETMASN